jgi:hemolysin-activating ACP:hemolysin acyltransferase
MKLMGPYIKHFTNPAFIEQCPSYKFKEYLDQNNYKKYKLVKVVEGMEGAIINGEYAYRLTDKKGNQIGNDVWAGSDKDAWDLLLEEAK